MTVSTKLESHNKAPPSKDLEDGREGEVDGVGCDGTGLLLPLSLLFPFFLPKESLPDGVF